MYQAIIFDLGNVLINISYPRILAYWSQVTGGQFADIQGIKGIIDPEERELETGRISAAEFRRRVTGKIGFHLSDLEFDRGWNHIFVEINPGIEQVLQQLQPSYRLVGLSNTNQIQYEKWQQEYQQLTTYFEKFFCSHEIGSRKPDAAAFQTVLDYLQLTPHQVVFIDDTPCNLQGASNLGITTILMQSVEQLARDLSGLGIKVDYQTQLMESS